ncbi:hypothetical protein BJX70DRAFT_362750, partial [Aspergillus crustosus]
MAPPRANKSSRHLSRGMKLEKKSTSNSQPGRKAQDHHQQKQQQRQPANYEDQGDDEDETDLSATIPVNLQQLLLNVFKTALLSDGPSPKNQISESGTAAAEEEKVLDIKTLIQKIKSHLYNRDFDSAFADADEELLRAYALRWSASRALGYAGLFKSLLGDLVKEGRGSGDSEPSKNHVVCIGGGAGAEIVALAAAWRDLIDEGAIPGSQRDLPGALGDLSLDNKYADDEPEPTSSITPQPESPPPNSLSINAVDIADWSTVIQRLTSTTQSPNVPGSKSHPAPLLTTQSQSQDANKTTSTTTTDYKMDFQRLDVLNLPDPPLKSLFPSSTTLVTLMFTLNELFTTSLPKTTSFLLRTTDILKTGTVLLVVDSPGSYSTLKLGKKSTTGGDGGEAGAVQERQYPMKFLLDHTLLSVAKGKWERVFSRDSRWWRRDAGRLWYDVGEGAGLEDMRYQIHVYRRL